MKKRTISKGFTLVELSIVLVIIGLLIGGILVAKSMISSAKTQKLISTMDQYIVAGRNFKTTYGYWPGDYPNSDFGCSGNGDGLIEFASGPNCNYAQWEGSNYFVQLSKTGFISQKLDYQTVADDGKILVVDGNVPAGPANDSAFIIENTSAIWNNDVAANARCIGSCMGRTSGDHPSGESFIFYTEVHSEINPDESRDLINVITPMEAFAVDTKIDDGMPNSGAVIGSGAGQPTTQEPTDSTGTCAVDGTNIWDTAQFQTTQPYNIATTFRTCTLGIKLTD